MPLPKLSPSQNASRRNVVAAILAAIALGGAAGGLDKLTDREEGNKLVAYQDIGGVWTICKGITHGVRPGEVRTEQQCAAANSAEGMKWLAVVDDGFTERQPDARRVAFADFALNVGQGNFARSTARRLINEGKIADGCSELKRWVYVNIGGVNRIIPWQVERRAIEYDLCMHDLVRP